MQILSSPLQIGPITAKNRIFVPSMVCFDWAGDDGMVTERHLCHYRSLAQGGAGLIFSEAVCVTKRGRLHETQLGLWDDGQIDGWKKLAEVCHAKGTPLLAQIHHAGINGIDPIAECPSDYTPHRPDLNQGKEITLDRIVFLRNAFVKAALRAKAAGLDGIELHGCHGYLFSQFMSRHINHRTDEYGQETLFAREVLESIRIACGPDFCVGIRLAAYEPALADGLRHAKELAPYVDFLDISYGIQSDCSACPGDFPFSAALYGAMEVKKLLPDMPVFGVHGIVSGEMAREALKLTGIDAIDVGKGHLVNYGFANAALTGQETGTCLHCKKCAWDPGMPADRRCPGHILLQRK